MELPRLQLILEYVGDACPIVWAAKYIRQHGSAVYVGMMVAVCIPSYNGKTALA